MKKPISDTVRSAVAAAQIGADRVTLTGQLGRAEYVAVNELLARIGGKWNKKAGAHLFDRDPRPLLEEALGAGVLPEKNPLCFYETPDALLDMIFGRLILPALMTGPVFRMLEPSAGNGAIANRLREIASVSGFGPNTLDTIETDEVRCEHLTKQGHAPLNMDFLKWRAPHPYDLIVMNPPFTALGSPSVWIAHVWHAFNMLAQTGILVAIVPNSWTFRTDSAHVDFAVLVQHHGYWMHNPASSFHASGTDVNTTTVLLRKERTS